MDQNQPQAPIGGTHPQPKPILTTPSSIILAGMIIAVAVYFNGHSGVVKGGEQNAGVASAEIKMKEVTSADHIIGDPKAPIILVEYSDTECPFCKQFHVTLNKIMDTYGKDGKVAWVYRSFPLEQLHKKAPKEAEALECAAELGGNDGFWKYTNKIYEVTTSNDSLDPTQLPIIATQVGLNADAFNTCLSSGKYKDKVQASYQDGINAGARGTPYSVLITAKGKVPITQGALPYEPMKQIIDGLLK